MSSIAGSIVSPVGGSAPASAHISIVPTRESLGEGSMICKLCQQDKQLVESHIIPKFVAKWLKDTSATGYLRQAVNPNLRRQDFPTESLLCRDCEGRFAVWEKLFAESVFLPYLNVGEREFVYTDWLLSFAISLSWRIGIIELDGFRHFRPHLVSFLEEALSEWRNSLLGSPSKARQYAHHLLFIDYVAGVEGVVLPDGFHWYALRGVDTTTVATSKEVLVYVKLPGMAFVSGVCPAKPTGWKNTQILDHGKIAASRQIVTHEWFGEFFLDRAQQSMRPKDTLSTRQELRIVEKMKKDPNRSLQSASFLVYLAERFWKKKQELP